MEHANYWLEIHCTVQYIGWNLSKRFPAFTSKNSCLSFMSQRHLKFFLKSAEGEVNTAKLNLQTLKI